MGRGLENGLVATSPLLALTVTFLYEPAPATHASYRVSSSPSVTAVLEEGYCF